MDRTDIAALVPASDLEGGSLAEAIFRSLLSKIYDGRLAAGALLSEAALAEEYRVSRGPVREAIRRLQGCQLVTREPYQRARVVQLTADFVKELFEARMALEGVACRLAAQRISDEELKQIAEELEQWRVRALASSSKSDVLAAVPEFDFHERIVRASGNKRIVEMLCSDMYHLLRIYRKRSGAVHERKAETYQVHWQILRALQQRDGELAESLMRVHIERSSDLLLNADGSAKPVAQC